MQNHIDVIVKETLKRMVLCFSLPLSLFFLLIWSFYIPASVLLLCISLLFVVEKRKKKIEEQHEYLSAGALPLWMAEQLLQIIMDAPCWGQICWTMPSIFSVKKRTETVWIRDFCFICACCANMSLSVSVRVYLEGKLTSERSVSGHFFATDTAASLKLALLFTKGHFYDTSACLHSEHTPALTSHTVIKTYTLKVIALRDISA